MMSVTEALQRRISIREFLPTPVPESTVREILDVARWAPSGGNVQPWKIIAVAGAERDAIVQLAHRTLAEHPQGWEDDRPVYPAKLWEPYRTRRYKLGEDMYRLLGIAREDRAGRLQRFAYNYELFGAPCALFVVIDERMGHGQWAHLGMFMQSIALAATERGLGTCMQEAWAALRPVLKTHFALPREDMVYCAIALGYPDMTKPVNTLRSDRAEVDEFAILRGF